jgi:hypothetical protein
MTLLEADRRHYHLEDPRDAEGNFIGGEVVAVFPQYVAAGQLDRAMETIEPHLKQRYIMGGPRPRLEAFFVRPGTSSTYSFCRDLEPVEASGFLADLWAQMAEPQYDQCLCNFYADGSQSISKHFDDEPDIDGRVFSVSLGDTRTFSIWRSDGLHKIDLTDGSALWFRGDLMAHAITKTKKPVGPRLSFTFRASKAVKR